MCSSLNIIKLTSEQGRAEINTFETGDRNQLVFHDCRGTIYTEDYLTSTYTEKTLDDRKATYALINMVSVCEDSNIGTWTIWEKELFMKQQKYCIRDMYEKAACIVKAP